ncbi:MAG: HD-GYP domain-containing protein [Bacillota bacterium]
MEVDSVNSRMNRGNNLNAIAKYFDAATRLSQLTFTSTSLESLLEKFVELLMDLLQLKKVGVMFFDPVMEEMTMKMSVGFQDSDSEKYCLKSSKRIIECLLSHKEPHLYNSKSMSLHHLKQSLNEPYDALYIPLLVGHEVRGVIILVKPEQPHPFTNDEIKIASTLTGYVALAMENIRLSDELTGLNLNFLNSLAGAIDARDNYTRMHSMRVTRYSIMTGVYMKLPQDNLELLRRGALLHDIGKIGIRDDILLKKGKLTLEERDLVRKHPEIGARILGPDGPFRLVVPLILHHHERYDGRGYPHGLKGVDIPTGARIIAVADAFEAMTSYRPYRRAYTRDKAVKELQLHAGTQFDPDVVAAFMSILKEDLSERDLF